MFVERRRWSQRADPEAWGVDWSEAQIAGGKGRPHVGLRAWGRRGILRLRGYNRPMRCEETARGRRFHLDNPGILTFEHADSLALPTGEIWTPEHGLLKTTLLLDARPAKNEWVFDYESEPGTRFCYQGELTPEEIDEGASRPPHIVGSYAVFDADGAKIAHVPRPFAVDVDGKWTWGTIAYANGAFTVTFDRAWLDAARYPVTVDPTFGYTSVGGTGINQGANRLWVCGSYSPASNGSCTAVTVYLGSALSDNFTPGIYSDAAGQPSTRLADGAGVAGDSNSGKWYTDTLDAPLDVIAGTPYWLAIHWGGNFDAYYDNVATVKSKYRDDTYSHGAIPATCGACSDRTREFSVYATYTETAAGEFDGRGLLRSMPLSLPRGMF